MVSRRDLLACLRHTGDGPVIRRNADSHVVTARNPAPGELRRLTQARLDSFEGMIRVQGLRRVLKAGDLKAAHGDRAPAIVVGGASPNAWPDYADFPVVVRLLRQKGFSAEEVGKLTGGNYVRVFNASVRTA